MERHFRILGVDVTFVAPAAVLEPIAFAYRRFAVPAGAEGLHLELTLRDVVVNGRSFPLVPDLDPALQLYQRFQTSLMDRIGGQAVLHAAAVVDPQGGVLLLAAPSGHGKSSLTLELARRGFAFLSDDYAPLELSSGRVLPYPRAVGVIPGERSPIPEAFRARALDPAAPSLFGKSLVDVGQVLGERSMAREPAPLRTVILLGGGGAPRTTLVDLACREEHGDEFERAFCSTRGAEILARKSLPHLRLWRLRLRHEEAPMDQLARVFDSDKVVLFEKQWDVKPDFGSLPHATPVRRREAAELLGREMMNRRVGGQLLAAYSGKVTPLFLDLAGSLREARCFRVDVGRFDATAELVERIARETHGDG